MSIVIDGAFRIPVDLVSAELREDMLRDLTFRSIDGTKWGYGGSQTIELLRYDKESGMLVMPRDYGLQRTEFWHEDIIWELCEQERVNFKFLWDVAERWAGQDRRRRSLYDAQKQVVEYVNDEICQAGEIYGKIISAPCGSGKTVIGFMLMAKLEFPALVVVNKEFLLEQWRDGALRMFSGSLREDEIGIVQGKKCEIDGKKLVIAMIQSLASRKYPDALYRWPYMVIFDECHRMSAPHFCKAASLFSAPIRIGFSATPERRDGLTDVFRWEIGRDVYRMDVKALIPRVNQLICDTDIYPPMYRGKGDKVFMARLINAVCRDRSFNLMIIDEVMKAACANRKVLVLSDRVKHLEFLHKEVREKLRGKSLRLGVLYSEYNEEKRKAVMDFDVVFATYQLCSEAFDLPEADTLFLTTPHSNVEQIGGRILRVTQDKKEPIIVDIVANLPESIVSARKRFAQYERLGWIVEQSIEV